MDYQDDGQVCLRPLGKLILTWRSGINEETKGNRITEVELEGQKNGFIGSGIAEFLTENFCSKLSDEKEEWIPARQDLQIYSRRRQVRSPNLRGLQPTQVEIKQDKRRGSES